ncbi:MAG TPA: response regulator [Magnetospirillaceae bacterium]|jgi:CheY-like chemotaxis protein
MMDLKDATVLIVDDERDLVEIFRRWFEREGSHVLTAQNGAVALERLAEQRVHLVVSDARMPVMDGIELAKHIKEECRPLPKVVFVSGYAELDEDELRELGIEAILSKPVDRKAILQIARQSLGDC